MEQKIYQVDAFTGEVFKGNPAAVCPLDSWLNDDILQKIAMENNLSETAFYVKHKDGYEIRWFTPTVEVDLCGHATLATSYVLFNHENHVGNEIRFYSPKSGELTVTKRNDSLTLNFPADIISQIEVTPELESCFNLKPTLAFQGKIDIMLVFESESQIAGIVPNLDNIAKLDSRGVIATAKGDQADFVSRYFGPQTGINEDPVTGSAHTTLMPYWSNVLQKNELTAIQLSSRKGYLQCKNLGNRIEISGQAKLYMVGMIYF